MPLSKERTIHLLPAEPVVSPRRNPSAAHLYALDLGFPRVETQHSTHVLHPYVAAMNPPLARTLLDTYVHGRANVLDPFVGGGCVLVEALHRGISSAGGDINPLGVLISSAKTTWLPAAEIDRIGIDIEMAARARYDKISVKVDPGLAFWFHDYTLPAIAALAEEIRAIESPAHQQLFQVLLSGTIRDVMLTYRGEVRLRRLESLDLERFNPDVFAAFNRRVGIAVHRVSALPREPGPVVGLEDARTLPYPDDSFTSIICSPPYADDLNGVGYFQFSRNMLQWLGMDRDEIMNHKRRFLGGERDSKSPPASRTLREALDCIRENGLNKQTHLKSAIAFYRDYHDSLREMLRVVQERVVIVIGNRVLSRTLFDNARITIDLMTDIGATLEDYFSRTIQKKRIANLGGDGGGINVEHILVFGK